jgi:hypothetical protein
MEEKEFIKAAEDFIYKEVAKNTNLLLGRNKTASLSTGIFLKLPIEIAVEQVEHPLPVLNTELKTFVHHMSAYTKLGDTTKVYFTFLYHELKDLKKLNRYLEKFSVFFAFVYLHEVQHILRKHITSSYNKLMNNITGDIPHAHQLINIAEDHAINYSLKDLFIASPLRSSWNAIEAVGMYDANYHSQKMSDIDILKDLLAQSKSMEVSELSPTFSKVEMDGKSSIQPIEPQGAEEGDGGDTKDSDKCSTKIDDIDASMTDLADSIKEIIQTNTKGSAAGELFEEIFSAVEVETGWFKKIKASFKRQVYYKTHDFNTSWANLNNTYRKIYKAPKKQFLDQKINIILSVDHSGSMSTEDLQKLLYLIESESTRINSITVLIHDTVVIKEFRIEDDYDIASSPNFKEALATRYTSGGTSHRCIFNHIQNMNLPDPDMVIYLSFSDNYSDIEECYKAYPVMNKLTKYWICAGANNPVKVPGTNIRMM